MIEKTFCNVCKHKEKNKQKFKCNKFPKMTHEHDKCTEWLPKQTWAEIIGVPTRRNSIYSEGQTGWTYGDC